MIAESAIISGINSLRCRSAAAPGRGPAALALSVLLAVTLTGCHERGLGGSSGGTKTGGILRFPGDGLPFGDAISSAEAGQKFSFGGLNVCLARPGRVVVDKVTPRHATGGLRVTDFGLRPNPVWRHHASLRDSRRPLDATNFRGGTTAHLRCQRRTARGHELALEVMKTSDGNARSSGWVVHYRTGGQRQKLTIPMRLVLCADPDVEAKGCALDL